MPLTAVDQKGRAKARILRQGGRVSHLGSKIIPMFEPSLGTVCSDGRPTPALAGPARRPTHPVLRHHPGS